MSGLPGDDTDMSYRARVLRYGDVSTALALLSDEREFLALNASHDAGYAVRELLNWLVVNVVGIADPDTGGPVERYDYIRRCAAGARPAGAPELISRYAPVAAVMNDFYWKFNGETRATPYPAQEITRAMTLIPAA